MTKNGHAPDYGGLPRDMLCGIGPCKPPCLQICRRMGVFVGVYSFSALVTSVLNMYIVSQITTIEKQYGLSSSQSGFLLSCNDIGFLLTTLFASYFARKVHIPRVLWGAVILYGVAGLFCSTPYFISRDLSLAQADDLIDSLSSRKSQPDNVTAVVHTSTRQSPLCFPVDKPGAGYSISSQNGSRSRCDVAGAGTSFGVGEPNQYTRMAMTIIAIGMILQGIAKAPRYPFLTTYVDDNVNKKNTAMYMGIISGLGVFGPAVAFGIGGLFSRNYVTLQDVPISPRHPAWIGAWWLGFVVFGLISMVIGLPLLCFPKRLRRTATHDKQITHEDTAKKTTLGFFKSFCRLISNMVYVPLVISTCCMLFGVAGMIGFCAKYIETQFYMPTWKANMILGIVTVFSGAIGTISGGFIVTKRQFTPLQCVKMLMVLSTLSGIGCAALYFFGCPNVEIVGFNTKSVNSSNSTCSSICGCDSDTYFPVCGSDNVNYMSPCHAGCTEQNGTVFTSCSCVGDGEGKATPGLCEASCPLLIPFFITLVISSFLATICMMPNFIVNIRCVSEHDKPLAIGFASFMSTICGWFAGPILFGMLIDTSCTIWSASCSAQGACALYDNSDFRLKFVSLVVLSKVLALVFQVIVFVKARNKTDWSTTTQGQDGDDGEVTISMLNKDGGESVRDPIYKPSKNSIV